jgi:hypothetical protein
MFSEVHLAVTNMFPSPTWPFWDLDFQWQYPAENAWISSQLDMSTWDFPHNDLDFLTNGTWILYVGPPSLWTSRWFFWSEASRKLQNRLTGRGHCRVIWSRRGWRRTARPLGFDAEIFHRNREFPSIDLIITYINVTKSKNVIKFEKKKRVVPQKMLSCFSIWF